MGVLSPENQRSVCDLMLSFKLGHNMNSILCRGD